MTRDRTQTIDSYAGDLAELPIYTSNSSNKSSNSWNIRVRTHSETEVLKKEDKVMIQLVNCSCFYMQYTLNKRECC